MKKAGKKIVQTAAFLVAGLFPALCVAAGTAEQAAQSAENRLRQDAKEQAIQVEKDRARLIRERALARKRFRAAKALFEKQTAAHAALREKAETLRQDLSDEIAEVKRVEETVQAARRRLAPVLARSAASPFLPAVNGGLVGMEEVRSLVAALVTEVRLSGTITTDALPVTDRDGKKIPADIIRVGSVAAMGVTQKGDAVFLVADAEGNTYRVADRRPGWGESRLIRNYLATGKGALPVDLTGGVALTGDLADTGWGHRIREGGILIWPIFLLGIVGFGIGMLRAAALFRMRTLDPLLADGVREAMKTGDRERACGILQSAERMPAAQVLLQGLGISAGKEGGQEEMDAALSECMDRLERWLPTLAVLAAVAPMIGLLGTVTGMIDTFQVISRFGAGDPRLMSGGISEALVTTQLGLAVAIPLMLTHHFLERRVDRLVADAEDRAGEIFGDRRKGEEIHA